MQNSSFPKRLAACLVLAVLIVTVGCGSEYRIIITPVTPPGGDPQTSHLAIVVNQAPPLSSGQCAEGGAPPCVGTTTEINVPGDSNMGNRTAGRNPVHGSFLGTSESFFVTANQASDNVTWQTLTSAGGSTSTISLPSGAGPTYVSSMIGSILYAVNTSTNSVSFISTSSPQVTQTVAVGSQPVAVVETPGTGSKVYIANRGDNTVSVVASTDGALLKTISVGTSPIWLDINTSGSQVYVLNNGSNSVSVIDTASDTVTATVQVGANPRHLFFEPRLLRLYVTNTGGNSVTVIDLATTPRVLATVGVGAAPANASALGDGSRVYVANTGSNSVSYIEANNLPAGARSVAGYKGMTPRWVAASPDSTKVLVANNDYTLNSDGSVQLPPGTTVIRASDNSIVTNIAAPFVDPNNCSNDNDRVQCPRQKPVFLTIGPKS